MARRVTGGRDHSHSLANLTVAGVLDVPKGGAFQPRANRIARLSRRLKLIALNVNRNTRKFGKRAGVIEVEDD